MARDDPVTKGDLFGATAILLAMGSTILLKLSLSVGDILWAASTTAFTVFFLFMASAAWFDGRCRQAAEVLFTDD